MRGDPPRLPARPAAGASSAASSASTGAAEDVRPLAGDPSARRRDDVGGRRSASASRLMGAVTRHLLEESEEERERVTGESSREAGADLAPAASAGSESSGKAGGGKAAARAAIGGARSRTPARGTPDPVVRRATSSTGRSTAPEDDVWAQGVEAADGSARVVAPETRIQPGRSAARIEGVRPEAADRVGRSPRMRIASWGAVLAAVAALVLMIAAGRLDLTPQASSGAGASGEGAGQPEATPGR